MDMVSSGDVQQREWPIARCTPLGIVAPGLAKCMGLIPGAAN